MCTYVYIFCNGSTYVYMQITELQKTATSICLLKTENGNGKLPFFAGNTNGKRKFVFLGHQTINGNRQQTVNGNRRLSFSKRAHLLWQDTRVDMNYCEIQFLAIVNRVNLAGSRQFSVVGNHWRHFSGMVPVPTSPVPGGIYDTASKPPDVPTAPLI